MAEKKKTNPLLTSGDAAKVYAELASATVIGHVMNKRLAKPGVHRLIDKVGGKLLARTANTSELSQVSAEALTKLYRQTGYWHGTGRYQHDQLNKNGQVVDVLSKILEANGLQTREDLFDPLTGPMKTTSLARSRIYARAYADMHGRGQNESERHGSAAFWAKYFMGSIVVSALQEVKPWTKAGRDFIRQADKPPDWGAKVNSELRGIITPFMFGSDTEGNYPILIGIKKGAVLQAPTSTPVAIHEFRASNDIAINDFTHLEVPRAKITETRTLLEQHGVDLPVISIEEAESLAATQPFSYHVKPT